MYTIRWQLQLFLISCFVLLNRTTLGENLFRAEDKDDLCMLNNRMGAACNLESICNRCIRTDGCAYNFNANVCQVASSETNSTSTNDICSSNDLLCNICPRTSESSVCRGTGGCFCTSICAPAAQLDIACRKDLMLVWMVITGLSLLGLITVFLRRKFGPTEPVNQVRQNRRPIIRGNAVPREHTGITLDLNAWRTHRTDHLQDLEDVQLKSCYILMKEKNDASTTANNVNNINEQSEVANVEHFLDAQPISQNNGSRPEVPANTVNN